MTPPDTAASVFGDRLPLAERFADWLIGPGIVRGLLGPREAERVWERHVLNGVGISTLIEPDCVVVDLGSGAGLPGIPLALSRPDLTVVLVEPKARRADFLREVCADLDLAVRVVRARATPDGLVLLPEGTAGEAVPLADVVTARAVAPIADLARWAGPLLRSGGHLLAVKGAAAAAELDSAGPGLNRLGFGHARILHVPWCDPDSRKVESDAATTTVVAMTFARVSRET